MYSEVVKAAAFRTGVYPAVISLFSASPRIPTLLLCATFSLAPSVFAQATAAEAGDQHSGVSHPPADSIEANEDPAAPEPRKPSPAVPATVPAPAQAAPPTAVQNPDYIVITGAEAQDPNTHTPPDATAQRDTHLVSRPPNPDYGIVGIVPSPSNQLAEGTNIKVRLMQTLSTKQTQDGDLFHTQVASNVYKEGRVVIPVGSELQGSVVFVGQGHRVGGHATLLLRPDTVILPDGTAYHLYAQAISVSQPGTHTDQEGGIQPKTHIVKDLAEYGGGAGGGAAIGGVVGGPVGAGAGALVGAGIVTTHLLLQKPEQAKIEQGAEITFSLTEAMNLLPTRN